jgi:hypothetical protein
MSYKESLYFVAKCLTISLEDNNRQEIEKLLQSDTIDWDVVVKVSTSHYVFPALYCNFKRADFLKYLPADLVEYMRHLTNLNRERNIQIIEQAKELNSLLLDNNITPIFLKGTGNLLAGIYDDIAERMVGDIDFIFSKEDYPKAIKVLLDNEYSAVPSLGFNRRHFRHFTRLQKENNIAAVEIHSELLINKYINEFNYDFVNKDIQLINEITVLGYSNKLNLSIIAYQINDNGLCFKTIALRNAYDVFLLSKKTNAKDALNTLDKLINPLNYFLAGCYEVFNSVDSLEYNKTKKAAAYLRDFKSQLSNTSKNIRRHNRIKNYLFIKSKIIDVYKHFLYKEFRVWLFKTLTNKNWYKRKLVQFGIRK